jgi:hypothetical protein
MDGSIGASRQVPIAGQTSLGIDGKLPLSFTLRWVPTVSSKNRLDSDSTVMGTLTFAF